MYDSAQALYTLQKLFGIFPRILGKGDSAAVSPFPLNPACVLMFLLARSASCYLAQPTNRSKCERRTRQHHDHLRQIRLSDRARQKSGHDHAAPDPTHISRPHRRSRRDQELYVTPFSASTNIFSHKSLQAHVEVPVSLLNAPANPPGPSTSPSASTAASTAPAHALAKEKKRKHHLTAANDPILAELRDLNFAVVGKRLNRIAHRLDEDFKVRWIFCFLPRPRLTC